jgi:sugar phosphate isomerase/epimerase
MLRRDFLARIAAGAASAGLGHRGDPFALTTQARAAAGASAKLERISISTWSLHNYFRATRRKDFNLPGPMVALLDFPELIADTYHVRHFEFCATHFSSVEPAYLQEIKYALERTRSTIVNMPLDIRECGPEGTFSDPDRITRREALDTVKQWVDVAHALGVRSVCVGPGKVDPEDLAISVESYKALAAYALAKGVRVIVENRGGFGTGHPEDLVRLLKLTGTGRIGALPDFGDFPDEPTREKGLKMFFPYAQTVCDAKGLEFNAAGAETRYDFPKVMEIARKAGYRGVYSIEFDGPGDPYAGIQKTLDELLKYL